MFEKMLSFSINHRLISLFIIIAVTIACFLGLKKLRIDTTLNTLVVQGSPEQKIYQRVKTEFGSDNTVLIVFEHDNLFSTKALRDIKKVTKALAKLPYADQVNSLFSVKTTRVTSSGVKTKLLISKVPTSRSGLKNLRKDVLKNKFLKGTLVSENGKVTAVTVLLKNYKPDPKYTLKIQDEIEALLAPMKKDFKQIFIMGKPRLQKDLTSLLLKDLSRLGLYSLLILMVMIWFFLRSTVAVIIPVLTALISIVWAFGLMGHFNIPINLLSAMLPSLIIVMGSTEDVHLFSGYLLGIEKQPGQRRFSTQYAINHVGIPVILTTLTTFLGFLANALSNLQLIKDFAYASSMAILANGVVTLLLVPLVLITIGPKKATRSQSATQSNKNLLAFIIRLIQTIVTRHKGKTLVITASIVIVFISFIPKIPINNNPLSYFKAKNPILMQTHFIGEHLTGTQLFFLRINAQKSNAFKKPAGLRDLDKIITHIKNNTPFNHATGLSDQVKYLYQKLNNDKSSYYKIPNDSSTVKRLLNAFKRDDIKRYVSKNYQTANIIVRHNITQSQQFNKARTDLKRYLHRNFGEKYKADISSLGLLIDSAATNLLKNQVRSIGLILIVIFIIMSLLFMTPRAGLLSLIPNIIPIILMFGLMGIVQLSLNPGTAVLAVIIIGIAVDDTIHLFSKYNLNCRSEGSSQLAIETTLKNEVLPVLTTSVSLAAGFLIMLASNFQVISNFGLLAAFTILAAMLSDLIITPILLQKVRLVSLLDILSLSVRKEVIEKSLLFKDMKKYEVRKAILLCEASQKTAGDLIIKQGAVERKMYLILSGSVEISMTTGKQTKVITTLKPGDTFGEIGYVNAVKRIANAKAIKDTELMVFDQDSLTRNTKRYPRLFIKMTTNISRILGERLKQTNAMI